MTAARQPRSGEEPVRPPSGGPAPDSGAPQDSPAAARERRRLERVESGRREILAVAEELFLRQGFDRTSLEQIATGSGYSVGSIYNFFAGKDAVYSAVLERHASSLGEVLHTAAESAGSGLDKVVEMARAAVLDLRGAPGRARLTATSMASDRDATEDRGAFGTVLACYAEALGEGQRDGTVRGGNPRHLAQFVGGLVLAQAQVDPEITGDPDGVRLGDFLDILRGALARPGS